VAVGKQLFELLKCQQCHVLGTIPKDQPTANLAPDLRMAHERLNSDWLLPWLRNPTAILPGTRMTQFWPDFPKSVYTSQLPQLKGLPAEYDGNAETQIRAVRDYLETLRGGPSPKTGEAKAANN
jgi:hypothetical protein